ncbi:hypothetical protein [Brevundimonas abyssalis]|uniref:hypothetical protein n=1 Tax=Brevundimonas abyssalis TaxID=1125965 RepID=UPI001F57FB8D|nr:hypothetical protein [Brevundimonas abyssalis]
MLFGATHDRDDTDEALRDADDLRNLEALKAVLPDLAVRVASVQVHRHAAIRAATRDRLPVAAGWRRGCSFSAGWAHADSRRRRCWRTMWRA